MFQLTVSLPSGRSEKLFVPRSSAVGDLKLLAQKTFGQGFLRLVADGKLGIAELSGVFFVYFQQDNLAKKGNSCGDILVFMGLSENVGLIFPMK